jgi:DNA-directed RNA polymerase specialized sigma24 family protein
MPVSDDSFASFSTGSYHRLLGQLFAVTGDLAEAENLLQEAYARAFVRWSRVRAYDLPEAWVRRVALNPAGMAPKRLRRRAAALLRLGPSTGTVKSRLVRGRRALAGSLAGDPQEVTRA